MTRKAMTEMDITEKRPPLVVGLTYSSATLGKASSSLTTFNACFLLMLEEPPSLLS